MKKIFAVAASLILVVVSANSQTLKKEPPPPTAKTKRGNSEIHTTYNCKRNPVEPPVCQGKRADVKRNPTVFWIRKGTVIPRQGKITTEVRYDMRKDKSFTEKYGFSDSYHSPKRNQNR